MIHNDTKQALLTVGGASVGTVPEGGRGVGGFTGATVGTRPEGGFGVGDGLEGGRGVGGFGEGATDMLSSSNRPPQKNSSSGKSSMNSTSPNSSVASVLPSNKANMANTLLLVIIMVLWFD